MKKNKNIAFVLAFFGVLLLLISLTFWLDRLTPGISMSEGAPIMDWITGMTGVVLLVGALVVHTRKN